MGKRRLPHIPPAAKELSAATPPVTANAVFDGLIRHIGADNIRRLCDACELFGVMDDPKGAAAVRRLRERLCIHACGRRAVGR